MQLFTVVPEYHYSFAQGTLSNCPSIFLHPYKCWPFSCSQALWCCCCWCMAGAASLSPTCLASPSRLLLQDLPFSLSFASWQVGDFHHLFYLVVLTHTKNTEKVACRTLTLFCPRHLRWVDYSRSGGTETCRDPCSWSGQQHHSLDHFSHPLIPSCWRKFFFFSCPSTIVTVAFQCT